MQRRNWRFVLPSYKHAGSTPGRRQPVAAAANANVSVNVCGHRSTANPPTASSTTLTAAKQSLLCCLDASLVAQTKLIPSGGADGGVFTDRLWTDKMNVTANVKTTDNHKSKKRRRESMMRVNQYGGDVAAV